MTSPSTRARGILAAPGSSTTPPPRSARPACRPTPLPPTSFPGLSTPPSSTTPLPGPRPALPRFRASGVGVLPACACASQRGEPRRAVAMAAGGSDPRAGDVEEDASQLIFPKGGAGAARLSRCPACSPQAWRCPRLAQGLAVAGSRAGSGRGAGRGEWGCGHGRGPGGLRQGSSRGAR